MKRMVSVFLLLVAAAYTQSAAGQQAADNLNEQQRLGRQVVAQACGVCHLPPAKGARTYGPALTARLTFAMARHAVLDLCAIFHLTPAPPAVDRLAPAEAKRLESVLAAAGVRFSADKASVAKLTALRATYEPYVQALSRFLIMPLPAWTPPEGAQDSWHTIA